MSALVDMEQEELEGAEHPEEEELEGAEHPEEVEDLQRHAELLIVLHLRGHGGRFAQIGPESLTLPLLQRRNGNVKAEKAMEPHVVPLVVSFKS